MPLTSPCDSGDTRRKARIATNNLGVEVRKLVFAMNVAFLLLVSGLYFSNLVKQHRDDREYRELDMEGTPFEWGDLGIFLLLASLPAMTLIYVVANGGKGNGFLDLYFQRRAAEERARIRKIEDELSRSKN